MAFAQSGRPDEQDVAPLADELAGGQFIDLLTTNAGVEAPVKVLQAFGVAETGQLAAFVQQPLAADIQLVLQDQFQELRVGQLVGLGLLQAQVQTG